MRPWRIGDSADPRVTDQSEFYACCPESMEALSSNIATATRRRRHHPPAFKVTRVPAVTKAPQPAPGFD